MTDETFDLFEALSTQRSIRSVRPDPVPDELLEKLVGYATKAPSSQNSQPWAFVVVRDRGQIEAIAAAVRADFAGMYAAALSRTKPGDPPPLPNLKKLVDRFDQLPVVVYPCLLLPAGTPNSEASRWYSSIFPAIQNLLLAARGLGLGAALTGRALSAVREILELPENVEPVACIPVGYPDEDHYGKTTRKPVSEVLHWDRW